MVLKADHRQDTHSHIEKGSMRYINATWPKLEEKRKQHIVRDRGQKKKKTIVYLLWKQLTRHTVRSVVFITQQM